MNRPARRLKMMDLNPHFTCVLCDGYFVDATTIVECLHSFCRACIVKYLETNKFCPVCDVRVHKTKPLLSIRSDKTLQDVVYKLVPGLYQNEMKRRREFYATRPEEASRCTSEERGEETNQRFIYTPYETISLSIEYARRDDADGSGIDTGHELHGDQIPPKRYLLCPAAITVGHLKKFITAKYDLPSSYKVEISYSDDTLNENYTLMDVAYNYSWKRTNPMRFCYRIVTNSPKRRKLLHIPSVESAPAAVLPPPTTTNNAAGNSSNNLEVPKKSSDLSSLSLVPSPSSSKQELKFVLRPRREEKEPANKHQASSSSSPAAASKQHHHEHESTHHKSTTNLHQQATPSREESSHHHHHHHQEQQQKITMTLSTAGIKRSNTDSTRGSDSILKVKHRSIEPSPSKSNLDPTPKKAAVSSSQTISASKSSKRPTRSRVKNKSVGRPPLAKLAPYPPSTTSVTVSSAVPVNHFVPSPVTCFSSANPVACLSPASCIGSLNYLASPTVTCLSSIMNHTQSDVVKSNTVPVPAVQGPACNAYGDTSDPKSIVQPPGPKITAAKLCAASSPSAPSCSTTVVNVSVNGVSSPENKDHLSSLSPAVSTGGLTQVPIADVTRKSSVTDNVNKVVPASSFEDKNSTNNSVPPHSVDSGSQQSGSLQLPTVNAVVTPSTEQNSQNLKAESIKAPMSTNGVAASLATTATESLNALSKNSVSTKKVTENSHCPNREVTKSEKSRENTSKKTDSDIPEKTKTNSTESTKESQVTEERNSSPVKNLDKNGLSSPISAEKNAINVPFKEVKSSIITAEFSDNDDLGCQPDLVVDEQKLDSSDNEDEEADDDALRRKITAIAEKDDEADTETDSGRASDVSNQARSSCDDESGSPMPNSGNQDAVSSSSSLVISCSPKFVTSTATSTPTTTSTTASSPTRPAKNGDEHAPSKPNGIDHIINNLHRNHERKDNIGALDLSTSNRKVVQEDSPRPRPRAVANPPVLDAKHRQQTCLPAPTKQHTACVPVPKHPTSSTFHIGALSASARHAAVMAAAAAPQNHLNKLTPTVTIPHFSPTPIMNSLPIKSSSAPTNAHFCRAPSSIHANVGMPAFPGKTYSPVTPRQNKTNPTTAAAATSQLALPATGGGTNSYHGKTPNANASPRRDSVSPRRTVSPSTSTAVSPHHRMSPSVTSPKSNNTSPSTTPATHVLPSVPSTSSYKMSRPPIPMYSKKSDSYKNSHHHRFKGNLTVINPDPNGYSQKIVIKNLNSGQSQHNNNNSNHQRV